MNIKRDTFVWVIVLKLWIISITVVAVEFTQIGEFDIPEANQGVGAEHKRLNLEKGWLDRYNRLAGSETSVLWSRVR